MNVIKPGSIPEKKISNSKMAFKCMENIGFFLQQAKDMGVLAEETFQTVDLWEKQNILAVVICLQAVARKVNKLAPRRTFCESVNFRRPQDTVQ